MSDQPGFDIQQAHRHFSARCFNAIWALIDKPERSADDDERMIHLAHASLWHWSQRSDCSDRNLSVGYWMASRVFALVGEADNARKYARLCRQVTRPGEPFYLGYASEAMARAEQAAGNEEMAARYLAEAWRYADQVTDAEEKQMLVNDLKALE